MKRSRAWWQERTKGFIPEFARVIEERLGADTLEAVFLCGSFALGEETVVLETEPPVLLSDVDLVAIVRSLDALSMWAPRRAELGAACESIMSDVRFSGRVDVGVMLAADLAALPPRPGVFDMRSSGRVLAGDPKILDLIPDYAPADMTVGEALILIENRIVALIGVRDAGGRTGADEFYGPWYGIARAYTDIATATLSVAGSYVPGYEARRALVGIRRGAGDALVSRLVSPGLLAKIERWSRYKLEPSAETVGAAPEPGAFAALWDEAARDILYFWRQVATHLRFPLRDVSDPLPVDELAAGASAYRDWRSHVRGWKSLLADLSVARRIALVLSLGGRLVARSPLETVREAGVRLLDHRVRFGSGRPVRGAQGGFPYRTGSWGRAADELCAEWNRLVFGRAEG